IDNDITGVTPAAFEPALDYVAVKVPRFTFEKFPGADPRLTTTMKSVGESMALGRSFAEALGKAMRSTETRATGFWTTPDPAGQTVEAVLDEITVPSTGSTYGVGLALRYGASIEHVHAATRIEPSFLDQIALLGELGEEPRATPVLDGDSCRRGKDNGLSDRQIAALRPPLA